MADRVRLGIIAGAGRLPGLVAAGARQAGYQPVTIAIEGQGGPADALDTIPFGKVGKLFKTLAGEDCTDVVFCGEVGRPNLSALKMDATGLALVPKIAPKLASGDNSLLSTIADVFEERGFRVRGPDEIMSHLLAGPGAITAGEPSAEDMDDARIALQVLSDLGRHDVGQACAVQNGRVLAIEAAEGTDALIRRVASLPRARRGGSDAGGVLVKAPKSGQDRRLDLPTIGLETVRAVAEARLNGVFVEAGGTLLVDREKMIDAATESGLFVCGITPDGEG